MLGQFNYDLLSTNNCQHCPSLDLLFRAVTSLSAKENINMTSLASLGDSFLKLSTVFAVYHQYPHENVDKFTIEKSDIVSNSTLRRASIKKQLIQFMHTKEVRFETQKLHWIPPGYVASESDSHFRKQECSKKCPADLVEALIGAVLLSTGCTATLKFMDAFNLLVIPRDENREIMKTPSILLTDETIANEYANLKLNEIEEILNYTFNNKAHLVATCTKMEYKT